MQYTETQLAKLIEDVEKEFTAHLAKAEEELTPPTTTAAPESTETEPTLAKAEEEKKPSEPEEKKDEKPEEKAQEAKEEKPEAKPEAEPKAEAKPESDEKPEAEHKEEGEKACDYDEEDMEHMHKMYSSMSKGELKAHHDCIASIAKCGDISQEKAPMAKSEEEIKTIEVKTEESKPNQEVELLKSELSAEKAKFEDLKKNFDAVAAFLTKLVEKKAAPAAKAITSLDVIAKSEGAGEEKTLTKGDIHTILCKKSSDPTLKKADREAINVYYAEGQVDTKGINHLLN